MVTVKHVYNYKLNLTKSNYIVIINKLHTRFFVFVKLLK